MTTPKVLTEADAAADLAGLPRAVSTPNDLPSVGTEDAPSMANYTFTIVADSGYESTTEGRCSAKQYGAVIYALHSDDSYADQRDKLAIRVRELESEVLDQCRLNGMGAERELALMNRVTELTRALTEARRWIGDGECSDGLPREYWTGDHTAVVELVDAALNASKEHP